MRWVIEDLGSDESFQLKIVASGSHFSEAYGLTYKEIENDGFAIDEKIPLDIFSNQAAR